MICKCGAAATHKSITRGKQKSTYWECEFCGREQADGRSAKLLDEKFNWQRVGWYQETLKPMEFLKTKTRMYDGCLLRRPDYYIAPIDSARKYLHGLIEADGNMICERGL